MINNLESFKNAYVTNTFRNLYPHPSPLKKVQDYSNSD